MTPQSIDWRRWLGVDEGLAAEIPFDRAVFRHWRCYWPFGGGMLTDLFVHRLTAILGLRRDSRTRRPVEGITWSMTIAIRRT